MIDLFSHFRIVALPSTASKSIAKHCVCRSCCYPFWAIGILELRSSRRASIRVRRELQKRLSEEGLKRGEEEAMNELEGYLGAGEGVSSEAAIWFGTLRR